MRAYEIELLGGPADGQRIAVPVGVTTPPQTVELQELPQEALRTFTGEVADGPLPIQSLVYRLDRRSISGGALWRYFYEEAAP